MEFEPEGASRCLQVLCVGFGIGIGWVGEQSHDARRRDQLAQQLQPFWHYLDIQLGHARDIATGPIEASYEVELHRIADGSEDNGNSGGCRLCGKRRRSGGCGNYRHLTTHQIGCHRRQPITMTFRPAVFDRHVTTIDVAFSSRPLRKAASCGP
jgi:hypothetical protein